MPSSKDDHQILTQQQLEAVPQLKWVDQYSRLLDTKFRIPGTKVRFGFDFLLGLVPGAGDALSLALSGVLIATMARHGASLRLVFRMLANVALDAIVGTVPLLGNVFDLFYKANYRNLILMRQYYDEGKHSGSIWPVVFGIFVIFSIMVAVLFVVISWLASWLTSAMAMMN